MASHRRVARLISLPGTEETDRVDVSHWLGVLQLRVELKGLSRTDILHIQVADIKLNRQFAWSQRVDNKACLIANELIHINLDFALSETALPLLLRRDIQFQSLHVYAADPHGCMQEVENVSAEAKLVNGNKWLNAGLVPIRVCGPEDL